MRNGDERGEESGNCTRVCIRGIHVQQDATCKVFEYIHTHTYTYIHT